MNPQADWLRSLFLLRPDVAFLNHGSFGACPKPVFDAYQAFQRELEDEPVEFLGRRYGTLMKQARTDLAEYLGAAADDVVFVPNATTAINTVAKSLELQPGDEILSTNIEYGALDRTWEDICERVGASYVRQAVTLPVTDRKTTADEIWSGFSKRTRVLFVSHITSCTALTLPIEPLIERAKAAGITTIVDGAHACGQIPLHLESLGADYYTGNCHKWMLAPKGCAFLYARREAQDAIRPLVTSWDDIAATDSRFVREMEYQGTSDISAYLTISAAIEFMHEHDWDTVHERCHELVNVYRAGMREITGLPSLSPDGLDWYAHMSAHPLPPCDGSALHLALFDEHLVEIPVSRGPGGTDFIRISVQAYNTRDDVDRALEGVRDLLPRFVAAAVS